MADLLNDITYETFGINPGDFYREKFIPPDVSGDLLTGVVGKHHFDSTKIRLLVDLLKTHLPFGGTVLDVGCGGGPYGPTLLKHVPGLRLVGLDLSKGSLELAKKNGYDEVECWDLRRGIARADATFDAVISVDFFGHVEFRYKDSLLLELSRVTRSGGINIHGVEVGIVDYLGCNADNPQDSIRKYVWLEGHIGIEPAHRFEERAIKYFSKVRRDLTFVYPFGSLKQLASESWGLDEELRSWLDQVGEGRTQEVVGVLLGWMNRHFVELYQRTFGDNLLPPGFPDGGEAELESPRSIARKLLRTVGFSTFVFWK